MRKLSIVLTLFLVIGLSAIPGRAQLTSFLNEPGSLLAFPLIDNINGVTIVSISNLSGNSGVTLECYSVTHRKDNPDAFTKNNFNITLTKKEAFVWNTASASPGVNGSLDGCKGFLFCFAVNNANDGSEIDHDYLIGDAKVLNLAGGYAWGYNAIPHEAVEIMADASCGPRVLCLDGDEYARAASTVFFQGLAALPPALDGVFVAANLDIDLTKIGGQPPAVLNFFCWNENETKRSRHDIILQTFEQYPLTGADLDLTFEQNGGVFGFHCSASATNNGAKPIWAVFGQNLLFYGWAGNVWQDPTSGADATIVLGDIP